jgi:hypothetical protein
VLQEGGIPGENRGNSEDCAATGRIQHDDFRQAQPVRCVWQSRKVPELHQDEVKHDHGGKHALGRVM